MFLQESGLASKVNSRIHTDSTVYSRQKHCNPTGYIKKSKAHRRTVSLHTAADKDGIISVHKIQTTGNTADIPATKYMSRETLQRLLCAAGIHARA